MIVPDWAGYQRFRGEFAGATDPEFFPIEWLDHQILNGRAWPVIGAEAAIVMEVRQYPGGARCGHVLVAAGDRDAIANVVAPQAEEWSRAQGCRYGLIESREGWAKVMKKHGWDIYQVALLKEL